MASTRAEDDAMLDRWAEDNKGNDDSLRLEGFLKTKAQSDDWHAIATCWNWDNGYEPLAWIIRRQECDKATAPEIYWLGEPWFYAWKVEAREKILDWSLDGFHLSAEIFERWTQGFYKRTEIAYDGTRHIPAQTVDRNRNIRDIPAPMGLKLEGRIIPTEDFYDGFLPLP